MVGFQIFLRCPYRINPVFWVFVCNGMCDDGKIAPSKMACVVEQSHDCLRCVFLAVRLGSHLLVKRQEGERLTI